ncbi:MAG: hypothetical protein K6T75_02600 [Acetobacteraceae bacterium]|nr:hypothetical protein [Acetobacteraceae bacterium]
MKPAKKRRARKWRHWLLVALGGVVAAFALLVVLLIAATRETILTAGVPLGRVQFTAGDLPGVPAYHRG